MSFLFPLGLLGLIGVPVLIIVYIIKSQYTEQTIASTYIWELSEKFLKKRLLTRFSGLLSLILQILAVVAISLTVAQPVFTIPDSAYKYCFVLDGSGSMNTVQSGETRLDAGKKKIKEIIERAHDGSYYSLVFVGDVISPVFTELTDKETAISRLDDINGTWSSANCVDAVSVLEENNFIDNAVYLVTDKDYELDNINLINVSTEGANYAFVSYDCKKTASTVTVTGSVISYADDAEITIELYADGQKLAINTEQGVKDVVKVAATKLVAAEFTLKADVQKFNCLKAVITNPDGLMQDNEAVIYDMEEAQNNRTLIISSNPEYIQFALLSLGNTSVETTTPKKYKDETEKYAGYNLYVFDSLTAEYTPEELPRNSSVWLINLHGSVPKSGFSFRDTAEAFGDGYYEPKYTTSTSALAKMLTKNLTKQKFAVKTYSKYATNRNFTNVMTCGNDPLMFAGLNENGDRQVTVAFNLRDSNFAMSYDFLPLMSNLLKYSLPSVVEDTVCFAGDSMTVNILAGCTNIVLESPSGQKTFPALDASYTEVSLMEAGTYTLTAFIDGNEHAYNIYSRVTAEESYAPVSGQITLPTAERALFDGIFDKLFPYFILLAVVFIADWGLYCYEQYQLR